MTTPWAGFPHKSLEQQWREAAAGVPKKPNPGQAKADAAERARQMAAAAVDPAEKAKQIAERRGWIVPGQTK